MIMANSVTKTGAPESQPALRWPTRPISAVVAGTGSCVPERVLTNADLEKEDTMYGEQWQRKVTLTSLVFHQIHHRAQIEVLMRQAGLRVPGLYGPSKEEWAAMGMTPQD